MSCFIWIILLSIFAAVAAISVFAVMQCLKGDPDKIDKDASAADKTTDAAPADKTAEPAAAAGEATGNADEEATAAAE